ncbi:MAG: hypothetical protein WBN57_07130 [Gammaproteobacteria bacterium]
MLLAVIQLQQLIRSNTDQNTIGELAVITGEFRLQFSPLQCWQSDKIAHEQAAIGNTQIAAANDVYVRLFIC